MRHVREELGAYVLGALEPADRHGVEAHLDGCSECRDELARLSVLPGLLDRLTVDEALADLGTAPAPPAQAAELLASEYARVRRALRRWRVATAAALVAAVSLGVWSWSPWQSPREGIVAVVVPVATDATEVEGTVATYAWEWGTTVEVQVVELPARARYVLWAVGVDGERERAGTWGPTAHRGALVRGATALPRDRITRVEITDDRGEQLLAADFGR